MLALEPVRRVPVGPVWWRRAASQLLWDVLTGAYQQLGFDTVRDEVFAALVGARIIEPASKLDTIRVLSELGVQAPHRNTIEQLPGPLCATGLSQPGRDRMLGPRVQLAGPVALVMYDLTTLHFEITDEDTLRKVGMSKEHRVDPQVTVGLLVTAGGFPLEIATCSRATRPRRRR